MTAEDLLPPCRRRGRAVMLALLSALALLLPMERAGAAGMRQLQIPADGDRPAMSGAVWYPCAGEPADIAFGPMTIRAVRDCPVTGGRLPLVVMSHGVGGWFGGHHDTAVRLADAGFVVAAINHPLDSGRSPLRRPGDLASMTGRPGDIRRLIDHMLTGWPEAGRIDRERIGFFGFSRGGFTGLAVIGGVPDFRLLLSDCPTYPGNRWCEQVRDGSAFALPIEHDGRIRAAVIADPAAGRLFAGAGLARVSVPVQLWGSERGGDGVTPADVTTVAEALPVRPEVRVVGGAGHFAFLPPCGEAFAAAVAAEGEAELCRDEGGFDRAAFHRAFNDAVLAFLAGRLGVAAAR
ncbi:alpha/beta hydrolase family protein [Azospirillum thermophilum]|nr:hypothetical protein [Azospirillum thermophilum]